MVRSAISVVGFDARPFGEEALAALAAARVVVGSERRLDAIRHLLPPVARSAAMTGDIELALDELAAAEGPGVILASGDPGFFGIVRRAVARFGRESVQVIPAVSSVSAAFARAAVSWDDAIVVSAHGRDPRQAVNVALRHPKVAVLTMPGFGPAELAQALAGLPRRLVVAELLGGPGERVTSGAPEEIAARDDWADPNVVLVLDESQTSERGWAWPQRTSAESWGLADSAFDHRDGMITKSEVRSVILARLGPGPGDLIWDVGAGSGSVAVEAARLGAAATAVDADADQCARIAANASRHQVPVEVVHGKAPDALAGLRDPDAIFVGGGGHLLTEILRVCAERARRAVVVALAAIERVPVAQRALEEAGYSADAAMIQVSRVAPLGDGHRLAAGNPVFVVEGRRP
ncbi:MAG TPA: precorrin-6y C5,15-methyltransferase (decarboxylating) subunit CbiE [Egibacteraceae bacterium]|nr:precorrin-6y C5,15-methyltransferase (decarboxylating) subunit CbiE [Egibacteraceae bacterium]